LIRWRILQRCRLSVDRSVARRQRQHAQNGHKALTYPYDAEFSSQRFIGHGFDTFLNVLFPWKSEKTKVSLPPKQCLKTRILPGAGVIFFYICLRADR
jgi:hypothetical protein